MSEIAVKDSVLLSIKKMLGIMPDYLYFDEDIIIHINSVFSILTQLGVGPSSGYSISSSEDLWTDFIEDYSILEMIKTYMYHRVKMMFDPSLNSAVLESYKQIIAELEWRILIAVDKKEEQ